MICVCLTSKGPGPEEDDGVSEPVSLAVEANLVHQCIGRNLVIMIMIIMMMIMMIMIIMIIMIMMIMIIINE